VLHGPRDLRLEDFSLETQKLGSDQVWVETEVSALSTGTDRGNYEGAEQVPGAPDYPRWVGYSNVGKVRAVGSDVGNFAVGDRVFAMQPHTSDYIAQESEGIVRVPDAVCSENAVFTKLYHLGFHSLRHGGDIEGKSVAVVGLGILGLLTVELARGQGARVIAIGNHPTRMARAAQLGADLAVTSDDPQLESLVDKFTDGGGVDVVVLTANPWAAYKVGMEILGKNGMMVILSLPGRGEPAIGFNPMSLSWIYAKGLTIVSTNKDHPDPVEVRRDFSFLLERMEKGWLNPSVLVTHRLPPERMGEAYELAYARDKSMIGTVFQWQ
jgi:2-desacetyl-2-hydroxyethyl bacteriochlorophyllide A dehydrogenase